MISIRRALLSVSDKTGLGELGQGLSGFGVELLASGGTARTLRDAGCAVTEVSAYTGASEMLGGRVKTLHPKIHGGILARRHEPADMADLAAHQMAPIDLVVVNLYPFEATVARAGTTLEEAIEQIDIGGPTLLRAAAKNFHDVVVLSDSADYAELLVQLRNNRGSIDRQTSRRLAEKVFVRVTAYDAAISHYLEQTSAGPFPQVMSAQYQKVLDLRYGENPHQQAAWYQVAGEPLTIGAAIQGKPLSYNNLLDIDAAMGLALDLRPHPFAAVIVKHGNPCGVGVSTSSLREAFLKARAGDPVSAFGGIFATSQPIDGETAERIGETFFEVVVAPAFCDEARTIFAKKQNLRVIPMQPDVQEVMRVRSVCGGRLVQTGDRESTMPDRWTVVTARTPTAEEMAALRFAWIVGKHTHSNAIVFATTDRTLGVGAGQMSRIDSVKIAEMKMREHGHRERRPCVAASDAFFPFRDGIDAIAAAGVTAIIQPGGSVRDAEVVAAANEAGVAMVVTGVRHFRH
ncbi:MAG: bifunctional phosphoribosylaminoimidazolecarboxamide formyltransferase/IMP cyclohydrolase [Deltaproteobacteria bacterium]|nr:bifunctional phosphoribosylaminoimidazolecarboxamide formyltransferase/IMP cyclohydrolase [Deltaproteobacteria bacterium]